MFKITRKPAERRTKVTKYGQTIHRNIMEGHK